MSLKDLVAKSELCTDSSPTHGMGTVWQFSVYESVCCDHGWRKTRNYAVFLSTVHKPILRAAIYFVPRVSHVAMQGFWMTL